jgi:RNA-splicing ligase RtcB
MIEAGALEQMRQAMELPISIKGGLMADAHLGYGLPVGGVLAIEGAIIPYAIGVDIACRMRLTFLNAGVGVFSDPLETVLQKSQSCFHKPFLRYFSRPR